MDTKTELKSLDPKTLYEEGLKLASSIKTMQWRILESQHEIHLADRKVNEFKDEASLIILNAIDDKGKKKYSNESARKMATNKLLQDGLAYQQALEDLRVLINSNKNDQVEIEYRKNHFRLVLAMLSSQ